MKILHVLPSYYPAVGGGQAHMKAISEGLAARGHEVHVFTQRILGDVNADIARALPEREQIGGVHVRRFEPLAAVSRSVSRLSKMRGTYKALRITLGQDMLRMIAEGPLIPAMLPARLRLKPDIVAVLGWHSPALPYQLSRFRSVRSASFVGIPLVHAADSWSHADLYRDLLGRCDAILANTDFEKRFIESRTPASCAVHAVGVGVDARAFSDPDGLRIRRRYGLEGFPVVGYVGRIQPTKGVGMLLRAMEVVWKTDDRVRLVLAGQRFPRESLADREFADTWKGLGAAAQSRIVHIPGFDEADKASIFDAMDVFAMPSMAESFGIAYLEAWLCRKPVIGARIGAVQCVIEDGKDGLLVDPQDPEDVAAAILRLVADRDARARMGQAGYDKTIARYTWEKVIGQIESIYRGLQQGRSG